MKFSNIGHLLIFYHSVSCKILDNSQPFITFLSLKKKTNGYILLSEKKREPTQFNSKSESYGNNLHSNSDDSDSKSKVQTFAICLLCIAQ